MFLFVFCRGLLTLLLACRTERVICVCSAIVDGSLSLMDCRANLVIAPSHLTKQWQDEVEAYCPSLRVIVITTKCQHQKVDWSCAVCLSV